MHALSSACAAHSPATQAEVNIRADQGTDPYGGIEIVTAETAPEGENPILVNAGNILVSCTNALPPKPLCMLPLGGQCAGARVRALPQYPCVCPGSCTTRPMAAERTQG